MLKLWEEILRHVVATILGFLLIELFRALLNQQPYWWPSPHLPMWCLHWLLWLLR